jgi:hypothetical protein
VFVVITLAFGALFLLTSAWQKAMSGPRHEWVLPDRPPFLTEQLAMTKGTETLVLDGFSPMDWKPWADDRTKAPDGQPDRFLLRNTINHNLGTIMYQKDNGQVRFVSVELVGDRVICQSSRGK